MLDKHKRFSAGVLIVLAGLSAGGMAMGASQDEAMDGPVRCEIKASTKNRMIMLESVVVADMSVTGTYQFKVKSAGGSGNSNIQQGGNFTAGPDAETVLGKVTLGNNGATYDVSLKVTADGETIECTERFSHTS